MKKFYFYDGFMFGVKADATFEDISMSLLTEALGHLSEDEKREFVDGIEKFGITKTSAGNTICVVKISSELRREFPGFSDAKKPLCKAVAEYEAELRNEKLHKEAETVGELYAYSTMPRAAWVERKDSLRRVESAGLLFSADASTMRLMVGDILFEGYIAAYRAYNSDEYQAYAPAKEIAEQANRVAKTLSARRGLGNATSAECVEFLKTKVFNGASYVEDHANGLLWAEKRGVAERVYGAHIAEAFRTALGSLGYSAADLEDLGGLQHWPVRQLDELGKRMLALLNGEDWVSP